MDYVKEKATWGVDPDERRFIEALRMQNMDKAEDLLPIVLDGAPGATGTAAIGVRGTKYESLACMEIAETYLTIARGAVGERRSEHIASGLRHSTEGLKVADMRKGWCVRLQRAHDELLELQAAVA